MTVRAATSLAATVFWLSVGFAAGQLPGAGGTAALRGVVTEAGTGLPLEGIAIHLDSRLAPAVAVTDATGRFSAGGLEAGTHLVFAERPGMIFTETCRDQPELPCTELTLPSDGILDTEMQMRRGAALSGRVLDADRGPVAGVRVSLGTYEYTAGVPGQRVLVDFPTIGEAHSRDLADCRGWLSRTVAPDDLIARCADLASIREVGHGVTNEQGEWRLEGVPRGEYVVRVSVDRGEALDRAFPDRQRGTWLPVYYPDTTFAEDALPVTVTSASEISGIDIRWIEHAPVAIRGTVLGLPEVAEERVFRIGGMVIRLDGLSMTIRTASGLRVPTAEDALAYAPSSSSAALDTETGEFEVLVPPFGDYVLTATAGGTHSGRIRVHVGETDVDGVRLLLTADADVTGLVLFDPRPAPEEITDVWATLSTSSTQQGTPLSPDGAFVFEKPTLSDWEISLSGLPEGYYLESADFGGVDLLRNGFNASDAPGSLIVIRVSDSPGEVTGRVVDTRGDAFEGAKVTLVPEGTLAGRRDLYRSVESDAEGRFTLETLPPGGYRVFAWESIPENAERNAEFRAPYLGRGRFVIVDRNGTVDLELPLIPR